MDDFGTFADTVKVELVSSIASLDRVLNLIDSPSRTTRKE